MDVPLLEINHQNLIHQYDANLSYVRELQATFSDDILPSIVDELQLDDHTISWAREWLEDTVTLFHIARRQNFIRPFALESIRRILVWRVQSLFPHVHAETLLHPLPPTSRDPLGRPIVVMDRLMAARDSGRNTSGRSAKTMLASTAERFRKYLRELNGEQAEHIRPVLQYVVVLNLEGVSIHHINVDLITWAIREITPRFPGMLAAVFMYNYSWTHVSVWTVIQHLLPKRALSRVFFPSKEDFLSYFSPSSLPEEYGGTLPSLRALNDPAHANPPPGDLTPPGPAGHPPSPPPLPPSSEPATTATASLIPPLSHLNPFFGYPTSAPSECSPLYTSHRTTGQLIRTLAVLLWERRGRQLSAVLTVLTVAWALRRASRGRWPFRW